MEAVNGYLILRELDEPQDKNDILLKVSKSLQPVRKLEVVSDQSEAYPIGTIVLVNTEECFNWGEEKAIKEDEVIAKWAK